MNYDYGDVVRLCLILECVFVGYVGWGLPCAN